MDSLEHLCESVNTWMENSSKPFPDRADIKVRTTLLQFVDSQTHSLVLYVQKEGHRHGVLQLQNMEELKEALVNIADSMPTLEEYWENECGGQLSQ